MATARRRSGVPPRIIGRDPRDFERDLQDYLDRLFDSGADGLPPDHGPTHSFDGSDPLTAPTATPSTVSGVSAADLGSGAAPAREDHVHPLDISGTPGAVGAVAAQGAGPGASLSGHTHRLSIPSAKAGLLTHDGTDPVELPGPPADGYRLMGDSAQAEGLLWVPTGSLGVYADTVSQAIDDTFEVFLLDATGGAITVTLPPAATYFYPTADTPTGKQYTIKKVDASVNTVTIDADGAETIDGALTYVLALQWQAVTLVTDGTQWYVIGKV